MYMRKHLNDVIDVCVINTDYGLGIVRAKGKIDLKKLVIDEKAFAEIDKLVYEDLVQDPKSMLNLKDPEYMATLIKEMK